MRSPAVRSEHDETNLTLLEMTSHPKLSLSRCIKQHEREYSIMPNLKI